MRDMLYPSPVRQPWPTFRSAILLMIALVTGLLPCVLHATSIPNDHLADAILLSGSPMSLTGSTLGAGLDIGEPLHAGLVSGGTVWYRWAAFSGGTLNLTATGQGYTARIAVYVQNAITLDYAHLKPVTSGVDGTAKFALTPGASYLIAVASGLRGSGPFTLNWKHTAPLTGGVDLVMIPESVHANVLTVGFSATDCEVVYGCTTRGTNRVLAIEFDVANRGKEDLYLGIPSTSPLTLPDPCINAHRFYGFLRFVLRDAKNVIVKMNEPLSHCFRDDRQENPASSATRRFGCNTLGGLQAGWVYESDPTIPCQLLDLSDIPAGSYSLEVTVDPWNRVIETNESNNSVRIPVTIEPECSGPPSNDARAKAMELIGTIATVKGNSECATKEVGEKQHYTSTPSGRSIWYRWTSPYTGQAVVTTEGSRFDTVLDVQSAPTNAINGVTLKSNDDLTPGVAQSLVRFNVTSGETYWFAVDGFNLGAGSQGGTVILNLNPALNNSFLSAQSLSGIQGEASGNTSRADREAGEPDLGDGTAAHSVWFRWVAPVTGPVAFDSQPSSFKTLLKAFTGSALNALALVPNGTISQSPEGAAQVGFPAIAGQVYLLVLDGRAGASGPYHLAWKQESEVVVEVRLTAAREAGGKVRLNVTGKPGQTFELQRSFNLKDWTTLGTTTVTQSSGSFLDESAPEHNQGFYRAIGQ